MQTFKQKKLALAVGSALLVMAGAAQAAATAPALRTTNPNLITNVASGTTAARGLYDGTGYNGDLTVTLNFTAGVATATSTSGFAQFGLLDPGADGFLVNNAPAGGGSSGNNPPGATDDVSITVTTATGSTTLPVVNSAFFANTAGATDSAGPATSAGSAWVIINPGAAPSAFRMSTTGLLQWTADIASAAWQDVMLAVNAPANTGTVRNGIITREVSATAPGNFAVPLANTVLANSTAMAAVAAAASVHNAVAPDPIVGTHGNGTGLVDGVIIDTLTPVIGGFTSANIGLSSSNTSGNLCAAGIKNGVSLTSVFGTAVDTTANTSATAIAIANSTSGLSRYPITISLPGAVDWTNGNTVADAAAYAAACFNTGVSTTGSGNANSGLPVAVTALAVLPSYSLIFNTGGTALTVALTPGALAVTDEATPVITKAEYTAPTTATPLLSDMVLTFSEPMGLIGINDGREIAQNVLIGADSLAALNLNAGTNIDTNNITNSLGLGTLTIKDILASQLVGKTVTVQKGISFKEPNDTSGGTNAYSIAKNHLDTDSLNATNGTVSDGTYTVELGGGIQSLSGAVEAPSLVGQLATLATASSITVGPGLSNDVFDTTARALTGADPTKIATVVVTFKAGKEIALGALKTLADLAADLVLTVSDGNFGVDGAYSNEFQWHPTAADLAISAAGNTLTITLPTELIYSHIDPVKTLDVRYLPQGETAGVLVSKTVPTVFVSAGDVPVSLPLAVSNTNSTLYTQSISGYFDAATAPTKDSSVTAYLAKWVDTSVMGATTVNSIRSGKITNPGNRVATDLAIEFIDGGEGCLPADLPVPVPGDYVPVYGRCVIKAVNNELSKSNADGGLKYYQDQAKQANALAARLGSVASKLAAAQANQTVKDFAAAAKIDSAAVMQKQIPVYVKLVRSSDTQASAKLGQNYLEARAIMATAAEFQAGLLHGAGTATDAATSGAGGDDPVYQVMLDVTTGKITGRLTGQLVFDKTTSPGQERGLYFVDSSGDLHSNASDAGSVASGLVTTSVDSAGGVPTGTPNSFNLLLGVDAKLAPNTLNLANTFVLAVLTDPGLPGATAYKNTLLTSANSAAANYVPFDANLLTMKGTRTTLSNTKLGTVAAPVLVFDLAKLKPLPLANSTNWALYGTGVPDVKAGADIMKAFDRNFVGLDTTGTGTPKSFWTSDGRCCDMAITLLGNKAAVAVESGFNGVTASTITGASVLKGANALAWSNDQSGNVRYDNQYPTPTLTDALFVQQVKPTNTAFVAGAVKLPVGWTLVNIPGALGETVTVLGAGVNAVIKVGAQADFVNYVSGDTQNQFTWIKATDGTMPALTAGEAVFVYSRSGGALR